MLKLFFAFLFMPLSAFASDCHENIPNLALEWIGWLILILFCIGYLFISLEDHFEIDKSKPAMFLGMFLLIIIGSYYRVYGMDMSIVKNHAEHMIVEIAEIYFFLYVAMTYIASMDHLGVFDRVNYVLKSRGYGYKKLFIVTGGICFFVSPFADNLTTALVLSTVLMQIEKDNKDFLVPSAVNLVVAANAGGAWSPFGDITTLMVWTNEKGVFSDFLYLFPASFLGYMLTAFLLIRKVPDEYPNLNLDNEKPQMLEGAKVVIILGFVTIISAILFFQVLNYPPMLGMMFGFTLLKLYSFKLKKVRGKDHFNVFKAISMIENNTLLFLFGILAAVAALQFVGWLNLLKLVYEPDILGPTNTNILVGVLSAIIDNVPVMSAVLNAGIDMDKSQWMLVTLTAGIGGSMISIGSAAGVGVMGKMKEIYTFDSHLSNFGAVFCGYLLSVAIWYLQYQVLSIGV